VQTPKTILIVDDDRGFREVCRSVLEVEGLSVVEANNGADALLWCLREPADVILLDLEMPVLDGWGFLQYRRRQARIREIPVGAITGQSDTTALHQGLLRLGVDRLVHKPVRREHLMSVIRELLTPPALSVIEPPEATPEDSPHRDPRLVFSILLRVRTPSSYAAGRLRDVSTGGLCAYLLRRLSSGMRINSSLPMLGRSVSLSGVVQWVEEESTASGYHHGIQFTEKQEDLFPVHVYSYFRTHVYTTESPS
jgi:CheY-like chemotaxis protein